ncbi:MAG: hypothetical protein ABF966_09090 [Bifidobacterium psychraerophilum]|uniref:hypothetical protein n=1 Tax=Bifidobacterium psychraerophilum TaxID=218140 RepID=UPI0039ED72FE
MMNNDSENNDSENNDSENNDSWENKIWTFQDAKQLLYDSRGKAGNEALWWDLEQALNDYRDTTDAQEKATALATVGFFANVVQRSRKDKEEADEEESKWVGWIPAGVIALIGLVLGVLGTYIYSLVPGSGHADASSLLKALAWRVSVCTAVLALVVLALNGWKSSITSEKVKQYIDYALYAVSWAVFFFSVLTIFFNRGR